MNKTKGSRLGVVALLATLVMLVAACGSDSDSEVDDSDVSTESVDVDTDSGTDAETDDADASTEPDDAETDGAVESEPVDPEVTVGVEDEEANVDLEDVPVDGLAVELGEWFVTPAGEIAAGANAFALNNNGEFAHALAVAKGTSYEDLPQLDNGAVDTETLGADFLGQSDNVAPGGESAISFDLEPGDYVFFCPIANGPNSHAGAGQVLSVTVAG